MIDLRTATSIETAVLVKWDVPNFDSAYLTDHKDSITYDGHTYTNIGNLLSISGTISELKSTPGDVTVHLSGVPTGSISTLLAQQIKGSSMTMYRSIMDSQNHIVTTTVMKFKGIVTNYAISDSVDVGAQLAVSTITLTCNSFIEVLNVKKVGRRTNPADFPNEYSMNRVRALANSNFNFGAP